MIRHIAFFAAALGLARVVAAQVRIEPAPPSARAVPAAVHRTTWADQLWGRSDVLPKAPPPENSLSCAEPVVLPDSLALVGGPGGVTSFDLWDTNANRWWRFKDPPNTADTVRGRVVGADCGTLPLRIEIRTATDYVAVNPGALGLDGVFVVQPGGALVPAVVRTDDSAHEIRVGPMSPLALKHRNDPTPTDADLREAALSKVRPKFRQLVRMHEVRIGMTADEADLAWGHPDTVNSTELEGEYKEQWVYPNGHYIYVENGVVWAIQR